MTNAVLTRNTAVCPANSPATGPTGIVLTSVPNVSVVKITGNGGPASFESKGMSSLQVCITGNGEVQFANMSIVFGGPATGHLRIAGDSRRRSLASRIGKTRRGRQRSTITMSASRVAVPQVEMADAKKQLHRAQGVDTGGLPCPPVGIRFHCPLIFTETR